jgi:curved DNA-binding protein CbpA
VKKKIHTHYDNLKTARNAPDEVIRAAYKALSQKYHPDKNPRPDAARIMAILNASYAVLSDEVQRRRHDEWIAEQESAQPAAILLPRQEHESIAQQDRAEAYAGGYRQVGMVSDGRFWRNWRFDTPHQLALLLCGVLALTVLMFSLLHDNPVSPLPSLMIAPYQGAARDDASPPRETESKKQNGDMLAPFKIVTVAPARIRFGVGPDGRPWPTGPRLYRDTGLPRGGLSTLIIDNSRNTHPVHVKIALDARPGETELYIPRHRLFSLENLLPGTYRLKYRDLQTGMAAQSNLLPLGDVTSGPDSEGVLVIGLLAMPTDSRDFRPIPASQF